MPSDIATEEKDYDGQSKHEVDEKHTSPSEVNYDIKDGDEALRLVGARRTAHHSEEYNLKLRRKLDMLIPPICAAVYFTQYLDKTSLNYASIMGLPVTGQHYNLVSLSFYVGFLVWEFPTMYISQKTRLAKYLGGNIVMWGIVLMLHAVARTFSAFFALRFFLGMLESCVAPILILVISMFYKKSEQATRISYFYVMLGMAQVFGGFTAYAVSFSTSKAILPYKIIYIFLGGLAILVGICVLIWLPDSPVHAHFLSKEERIAALERVRNDQVGTENKRFKKEQVWEAITDVRTWLIVISTFMTGVPSGALGSFSNIIIKNIGYTSRQTLIISTPGGFVYSCITIFCGYYSDKKNERMLPVVFAVTPTIVGAAILIGLNGSERKGALLFGVYLISTFGAALSLIYSWNASNTSGHTKKVTINAMTLVSYALGNVAGTEIFQPKDAPGYVPGKIVILVLLSSQICISFVLRWLNIYRNRKKRHVLEQEISRNAWTEEDIERERQRHAFLDLTDRQNMFFVYTL
ncbi:MFS general substrate transporter [Hysterangium stoloniferum]|nr:MFS general substrate transporter [Hysterangium stoloniferum]